VIVGGLGEKVVSGAPSNEQLQKMDVVVCGVVMLVCLAKDTIKRQLSFCGCVSQRVGERKCARDLLRIGFAIQSVIRRVGATSGCDDHGGGFSGEKRERSSCPHFASVRHARAAL